MRRGIFSALCAFLLTVPTMYAQWVATDLGNLAQGIVNSVNETVETSETTQNAMSTLKEASKIYEQSRRYYDMLKSVSSLVSRSLEVKGPVLMLSEILGSYVTNHGKMLTDEDYTQRELEAIAFGYNNIMKRSNASVAGLKDIINPAGMSVIDKERLDLIEGVYREMRHYRMPVNHYTRKNLRVSYLRAREKSEAEQALKLYGEGGCYW